MIEVDDHRLCLVLLLVSLNRSEKREGDTSNFSQGRIVTVKYTTPADWMRKGKASDFIKPFHVQPGDKFVILCRVSTCEQGKRNNLSAQQQNLKKEIESRGGIVAAEPIEHEWSGRDPGWLYKLIEAGRLALKHDATLIAVTTDRFIRSQWFRSDKRLWSKAQAQQGDLEDLAFCTLGVPLMTYVDPDATPSDCRSLVTKWGQESKCKKGGRPCTEDRTPGHRKRRKERRLSRVVELHKQGLSVRDIAAKVNEEARGQDNLDTMTVCRWIREAGL